MIRHKVDPYMNAFCGRINWDYGAKFWKFVTCKKCLLKKK